MKDDEETQTFLNEQDKEQAPKQNKFSKQLNFFILVQFTILLLINLTCLLNDHFKHKIQNTKHLPQFSIVLVFASLIYFAQDSDDQTQVGKIVFFSMYIIGEQLGVTYFFQKQDRKDVKLCLFLLTAFLSASVTQLFLSEKLFKVARYYVFSIILVLMNILGVEYFGLSFGQIVLRTVLVWSFAMLYWKGLSKISKKYDKLCLKFLLKANFEMLIYLFEFILEVFEGKKLDPSKTNKMLEVSVKDEKEDKEKNDHEEEEVKEEKSQKSQKVEPQQESLKDIVNEIKDEVLS